jgi:hypothetical protein
MPDRLETYLEEISHFLSGRAEREEILSEIRSHILEKASEGSGTAAGPSDAALEKAIAAYGPPRKVAERYLDDRPLIAPAYKRYLVRYTSLLFLGHAALVVFAVALKEDFIVFPFLFVPPLNLFSALMYLPTALLTDLGIVALVLYVVTQSGKDIKLPWPRLGIDLDEIKPPRRTFWQKLGTAFAAVVMLALTDLALYVFARHGTIFLKDLTSGAPLPLLTPVAGRRISLVLIALLAVSTMTLFVKLLSRSRWVDIVSSAATLALIGLLLSQPFDGLLAVPISERALKALKYTVVFSLLFTAMMIAIDLVKNIGRVSRRGLDRAAQGRVR